MSPTLAWAVLIIGFALPLVHVLVTPGLSRRDVDTAGVGRGEGSGGGCPFSPRAGWIVLVVLLGPIGWLMFVNSRRTRAKRLALAHVQPNTTNPSAAIQNKANEAE